MIITREYNGLKVSVELTENEIAKAYEEQLRKDYLQELEYVIDYRNSNIKNRIDKNKILADKDLCSSLTNMYKYNLYKNYMDVWQDTIKHHIPSIYFITEED